MSIADTIPGCDALVSRVMDHSTNVDSMLHGPAHWRCVAWTGLQLLGDVRGADASVVFLFGLIHDAMRLNDGSDVDHGHRAGFLAMRLNGQVFHLDDARLRTLVYACDHHTAGRTSADPTIGVCWDADRLNLWRVGIRPNLRFLSTASAKTPQTITRAGKFEAQHLAWSSIFAAAVEASDRVAI